jgi:hypothetical protein
MTSEKKNEMGGADSNSHEFDDRVRKIRKAAAIALKELDQLRLAHRCVSHIRGSAELRHPIQSFLREKIAAHPTRNLTGKIIVK